MTKAELQSIVKGHGDSLMVEGDDLSGGDFQGADLMEGDFHFHS